MTRWSEILKASKGLHARDSFSEMWGLKVKANKAEWPEITITGTLPLTYTSRAEHALKNYTVYGTSAGAGVACESGEPTGYKIPLTNTGKNLYKNDGSMFYGPGYNLVVNKTPARWQKYDGPAITFRIPCKPSTQYILWLPATTSIFRVATVSSTEVPTGTQPSGYVEANILINSSNQNTATFTTPSDAQYIVFQPYSRDEQTIKSGMIVTENIATYSLYIGSSKLGEEEYVDYATQKIYKVVEGVLTPTDPPAPLPDITAYQGENTLSSTETVGECSVTGRIKSV